MADSLDRSSNKPILGILLGAAVVALGVLAYLYYDRSTGSRGEDRRPRLLRRDHQGQGRRHRGRQALGMRFVIAREGGNPEPLALATSILDTGSRPAMTKSLGHEHGGAGELALAQALQRRIGFSQLHRYDRRLHRHFRRKRQELVAHPRGSGWRRSGPRALPRAVVGEARDVAHMDAAAHHDAAFAQRLSAAGTSAPTGAKMMAASSVSGGASSEPPAHTAPSSRAKSCVGSSPGA